MGRYLCCALYLKRLLVFSLISDTFLIKDILTTTSKPHESPESQERNRVSKAVRETATETEANVPVWSESDATDSTYHSSFLCSCTGKLFRNFFSC